MEAMPDIIQKLVVKACKYNYKYDHIFNLIPQLDPTVQQIYKQQNKTDRSTVYIQPAVKLLVLDRLCQIKKLFNLIPDASIPFCFRKYTVCRSGCIQSKVRRNQKKCCHSGRQ